MLTVPKIKDLIHKQQEQYNDLLKNVQNSVNDKTLKNESSANENAEMYSELQKYMEEMHKSK